MRIASRISNLSLIALLSLALAPSAFAQMRFEEHPDREMHPGAEATPRGYEHETEQRSKDVEQNRSAREGTDARVERVEPGTARRVETVPGRAVPGVGVPGRGVPGRAVAPRADARYRGCAYEGRRGRGSDCDYYYDSQGVYYDVEGQPMPGWSPDQPMPSGSMDSTGSSPSQAPDVSPGAAKIAPPQEGSVDEDYTPQGGNSLRDKMIAGRQNWLHKKQALDDANQALAQAEYQQQQTGRSIDPRVIARQQQAEKDANAAYEALAPLVEQAREAGISPHMIDLYNEINNDAE